ncbi:MAG: DUF2254 domain-containing protein [Candidatus Thiodiazotropha sp.]
MFIRARLSYLRDKLDTSIWLIPLGLSGLGALLAVALLWFDRQLNSAFPVIRSLGNDLESVRQILGVIAASIISVGGVAFSVTMVALTLTSGQYGPKILRNFLENKTSKVSLGLFLATYVYSLIVLTGLRADDQLQVTLIVALGLAFVALVGFIRFIHQTATELQADAIIHRLGTHLDEGLSGMVQECADATRSESTLEWRRRARSCEQVSVAANRQGYVQSVNYPGLCEWCRQNDCLLEVRVRAGDFILNRLTLFKVFHPAGRCPDESAVDELNAHVFTGPMRTPVQDPEYPITQINQLAARALSPGINDPGTAITCIDWFTLALGHIVDSNLPGCVFLDQEQTPRVIARITRFKGLMDTIYVPLRRHAGSELSVSVALMKSLCMLSELTLRPDRLRDIAQHADLIWAAIGQLEMSDYDRQSVKAHYARLQITLATGSQKRVQ